MLVLAAGADCRQVSFSLWQFPESEVVHPGRADVCAEKPRAPVPAQTIPHRLGPVPKRFLLCGDPSAPAAGSCAHLSQARGRL